MVGWSPPNGVFSSVNPATGEVMGHAPDAGVAEAQAAVAAARRAFDTTSWSTEVQLRVRCLDQLHQALIDHANELRELTIAEVGATPRSDPWCAAGPAGRGSSAITPTCCGPTR